MPKNVDTCAENNGGGIGLLIAGSLVIGVPALLVLAAVAVPTWAGFIFAAVWLYGGGWIATTVIGGIMIIAGVVLKIRARDACADERLK